MHAIHVIVRIQYALVKMKCVVNYVHVGTCTTFFKFEMRTKISGIEHFLTKSFSSKSKPIPLTRDQEIHVRLKTNTFRYLFVAQGPEIST